MATRASQLAQELSDLLAKSGRRFIIAFEVTMPDAASGNRKFRLWNSDCETQQDADDLQNLWLNADEALFEPCGEEAR